MFSCIPDNVNVGKNDIGRSAGTQSSVWYDASLDIQSQENSKTRAAGLNASVSYFVYPFLLVVVLFVGRFL